MHFRGGFFFSKSLLCFKPCPKGTEEGACTEEMLRNLAEDCCVDKGTQYEEEGDLQLADSCHLGWLEKNASRVPLEDFKRRDGLFVF